MKRVTRNCPECGQLMSAEKDHSCPPPLVGAVCIDKRTGKPMLNREARLARERASGGKNVQR